MPQENNRDNWPNDGPKNEVANSCSGWHHPPIDGDTNE